jgi:hypothetical protein
LRRDSRSVVGVLADCGDGRGRGEEGGTLGGGGGAEAFAHGGAGAGVGHAVVEELVGPVGADGHGLDLVRQQRGAGFCGEVAGFLGFPNGAVEDGDPFAHDGGDAVADGTAAAVEFERGGGEETAAGEELLLDVRKPAVEQIPQTGQAFGRGQRGARDLIYKNLAGGFDGGQLQVFFRTEVGEEAALAHAEFFGETADGEALEAFDGGNVYGAAEDGVAGADAAGLVSGCGLAWGAEGGRHDGECNTEE